ncbi:hypothetical protein EDB19DRAFT_2040134 [Suillus lakei]|nr:hypothetical protein EDB19DRAFT_2040134 [Suillus lakei]
MAASASASRGAGVVTHCPVGVDAERVVRDTLRAGIQPKLEALRALYADKKIVGRDKLDVVKGVLFPGGYVV